MFELIKSKCIPILFYGTDVCPMNSADRHSLQFTINKIVYKILGAMSKDLYIEISAHFGIESVENLIADRRNRFYRAMLCIRGTSHRPAVSVCPCPCLSQVGVLLKRLNVGSHK